MADANTAIPTTRIDCRTPGPVQVPEKNTRLDFNSPRAFTDLGLQYDFSIDNTEDDTAVITIPDPNQVPAPPPLGWTLGPLALYFQHGRVQFSTSRPSQKVIVSSSKPASR